MKKFLSLLLAAALVLSLGIPALAAEDVPNYDHLIMPLEDEAIPVQATDVTGSMEGSIVILHSNDVHGAVEGYAKMARFKEMYTLMGAEVFVMDAGDFIQGDTAVSVSQGATAVELMNLVGYDVAAPGNHEFDYGYENLKKLAGEAKFPILAANVTYEGEAAFGDHILLETATGKKLGVFGLDTPETASKAHPAKIAGVKFAGGEELYQTAQAQVDALKARGADYIVCLGHLGIDEETAATANRSIDLLEKVNGIDVFIDGHSHSTNEQIAEKTNESRTVNGAVLTSTGTKFANIGVVTIAPDGVVTTETWDVSGEGVEPDPAIAARAAAIKAEIESIYGAKFAQTEVALDGNKAPGVRTQETNLGDLIADALLWYATKDGALKVDAAHTVAITNGGGIRASIEAGDVTRKDINTVLPFGNTVAVVYVSPAELLEVLEASTFCTPEAVGAFPQVAGLEFTVNTAAAYDQGALYGDTTYYAPASIGRVSINAVNGKPLEENATYAVVTNDFLAAGGDTYYALSASDAIVDTGTPMDEAVMDYITTQLNGVVPAERYGAPQGRIHIEDKVPMWYDNAVAAVTERGLMTGTGNGFEPDAIVTRATVFQTLYNLEGKPVVSGPSGHLGEWNEMLEGISGYWWTDAARWAYETQLTTGTGGNGFAGDRAITRAELVVILERYAQYKNADMTAGDHVELLTNYADAELLTTWSVDAFQWAVGAQVISGKTSPAGNLLAPGQNATRAELAQILVNFTHFFTRSAQ